MNTKAELIRRNEVFPSESDIKATLINLLSNCRRVVELSERNYWIRIAHNLCHYSVANTITMLKKYVKGDTMHADVSQFIKESATCVYKLAIVIEG